MDLTSAFNVAPIERDESYKRDYIPLPGGWEIQTKGEGSTYRLCDPKGDRLAIPDSPYLQEDMTRMAQDVNAAWAAQVTTLTDEIKRLQNLLTAHEEAFAEILEGTNKDLQTALDNSLATKETLENIRRDLAPIIANSHRWLLVRDGAIMSDGRPYVTSHGQPVLCGIEADVMVDAYLPKKEPKT